MAFVYPSHPFDFDLREKTIIIPVVSTANVAQLAVDLLIASLALGSIATLDPAYCVPVVGAREQAQPGITTPLELYGHPDVAFVVVQQRSPVLKARKQEYVDALYAFIQASQFSAVLFLSGMDLLNRTDSQMMTATYQLRAPNAAPLDTTSLKELNILPIPVYTSPAQQSEGSGLPNAGAESVVSFIPGGGLTRRLLSSVPLGWDIPTASILQFALEGDNRADAGFLASVVVKVMGTEVKQWKQPGSWKDGLFGTPHDQTLYG